MLAIPVMFSMTDVKILHFPKTYFSPSGHWFVPKSWPYSGLYAGWHFCQSHIVLVDGSYVDVNSYIQPVEMCFMTWNKLNETCMWHPFSKLIILMIFEDPFSFIFCSSHPSIFLPVDSGFYPSKWWMERSLHKVMTILPLAECAKCVSLWN